jgi:multiple sugar transport system substrate-binding protein
MKFRTAGAAAVVAGFAITLVGCAGPADQGGEPEKLTIMITNSPSAKALEATAELYTEETGIDIEFVDVPYDQLSTKLVLAGQSKTSTFDIAMLDPLFLASVAPSGGLLALDDYIEGDADYDFADFPESLQEYPKYDGVTYGLPLSTEPYVQFYRTDLYEEAGLTPGTTWEEIDANAKAITAMGPDHYGFSGWYGAQGAGTEPYLERLYQYGGRMLDPETWEPLLDSDVAKQAMKDFIALAPDSPEATLSGSSIEAATQFTQFDVGLNIAPSGWYPALDDPNASKASGLVGVAPVPSNPIGEFDPKGILKGWMVGISAQSQYLDASWDFLSFALRADNVQTFIDAGSPVVGRISTLENPDYLEQLPYLEYIAPGVENGQGLPAIPELVPVAVELGNAINSMATQGADVDSTMDDVNEKIRGILEDAGRLGS